MDYCYKVICITLETKCAKLIHLFEPPREKTGLRGFRPGLTQTGLHSHRRWLEA